MEDEILHKLLIGDQEGYERALFDKHRFDNYEDRHKLLYGKKGAGKKDYAEILHQVGILNEFPFIIGNINDDPERAKQDIFGYIEFSKQNNKSNFHPGLIELAGKGTLYLHDINLLPAEVLKELIAFTYKSDKSYLPINSTERKQFDARLILSTDLEEIDIPKDFFSPFEFNFSIPEKILPLNQQPDRIKELANLIMNSICREKEIDSITFAPDAMDALINYDWAGGISQMYEEIEASIEKEYKENKGVLEKSPLITLDCLSVTLRLAYSSLENDSTAKTSLATNVNDEVRICFYRKKTNDEKWVIGFEGKAKEIKNVLGFEQVRYLLENPNRLLHVAELTTLGKHYSDDLESRKYDEAYSDNLICGVTYYIARDGNLKKLKIEKIQKRINQTEQNISDLEESLNSDIDMEEKITCKDELAYLKNLLKDYNKMLYDKKNGKEEIQLNPDDEKSRSMLIRRVNTVLKVLKKNKIDLDEYLEWEENIYVGRLGAYYRYPKGCDFLETSKYIWNAPEFRDQNRPKWILTDQ